jgi:hypothetical protein
MLTKKQKAAAQTTAQKHVHLHILYQTTFSESTEKFRIGELLLYLQKSHSQTQREKCWAALEIKLRHYYDLRAAGRST